MGRFSFKAIDASGNIVRGEIQASSETAALAQLQQAGHLPVFAVDASKAGLSTLMRRDLFGARRASTRELAAATHDLASLLESGLALDRALEILIDSTERKRLRRQLVKVLDQVRDGSPLADALANSDKTFPRFLISTVRAGEAGGSLEVTLKSASAHLAKIDAVKEAITSALIYPTILVFTAGLSITFVLTFVLPQFEPLFRDAGKQLPTITRIVMAAGHIVGSYGWVFLILFIGGAVALRHALQQARFRRRWDAVALRLPAVGRLITKIETARFSRTLGTLVRNGLTLPDALRITQETLSNRAFAEDVGATAANIREGGGLAEWLRRTRTFPPLGLQLIQLGEETGKLDEMLLRQADIYERESQRTIDRLLAVLVPALTLGLGLVVAGIVASLLVALISINDLAV